MSRWRERSHSAMTKVLTHMCVSLDGFVAQPDGWGDTPPAGAPVVVVTHRPPPEDAAERFPRTTFTGSVEEGIAAAKEIAGDRFVTIASADIIQQALNLGLVDEVCVSLVPVLFGTGIRYFGDLIGGHVMLEDPVVVQGER